MSETESEIDRDSDTTSRQTDTQATRHVTDRQAYIQTEKQPETERKTTRQTERQPVTDRQTTRDTQTRIRTYKYAVRETDKEKFHSASCLGRERKQVVTG